MSETSEEIIEVRSDVNNFSSIGEALNEALIRAGGDSVYIHSKDESQEHNLDDGEDCFCHPAKITGMIGNTHT